MPPIINCHSCHGRMTLPPTSPGQRVRCPRCAVAFVPGLTLAPTRAAAEPSASPFDFGGADAPFDFREDLDAVEDRRELQRTAAPAAGWMGLAGTLYIVLAMVYIMSTVANVLQTSASQAMGTLVGGLIGVGIAASLGCLLRETGQTLARGRIPNGLHTSSILALVVGTLNGLIGLLGLAVTALMLVALARGAAFGNPWMLLGISGASLFFVAVAACSLNAGVKGLTLPRDA